MAKGDAAKSAGQSKFKVFLSYSRQDEKAADQMVASLESRGFAVTIDKRDLPYGEKWQKELAGFINEADAVVFLVTPRSIASQWCKWEVSQVAAQSKRIVPVVLEAVAPAELPPEIGEVHLFPFTPDLDFGSCADQLARILLTDRTWIQEHTRLAELARAWAANDSSRDRLLRGQALAAAERWMARRPEAAPAPSQDHLGFIAASQVAAKRGARMWVGGLAVVAIGASALAGLAAWQRHIATTQLDLALVAQSRSIAQVASGRAEVQDHVSAILYSIEGLRDLKADDSISRERPPVTEAEYSLGAGLINRREQVLFSGHSGQILKASYTADGKNAFTISEDNTVRLWDAATGEQSADFACETIDKWSVATSADRTRLGIVCHGELPETCSLIMLDGGTLNSIVDTPIDCGRDIVAISSDGSALLIDNGDILSGASGNTVGELEGLAISGAQFSPDGTLIAVPGGVDREPVAKIYDAKSGKLLHSLEGHEHWVLFVAFSSDSKLLATSSHDKTARIWSASTGEAISILNVQDGIVDRAVFSPDGKAVATTSTDHSVRLWEPTSGLEKARLTGHTDRITDLAFDPSGFLMATASIDGTVRIWNAWAGEPFAVLRSSERYIDSVSFGSDGDTLLAVFEDMTARILATRESFRYVSAGDEGLGHKNGVLEAGYLSNDGRKLITLSSAHEARLFDLAELTSTELADGVESQVTAAVIDGRDHLLLTGALDGTAQLWSLETGLRSGQPMPHNAPVTAVSIGASDHIAVTGTQDGLISIWDVASGKLVNTIEGHLNRITSISISDSELYFATTSEDGKLKIWETATKKQVFEKASSQLAYRHTVFLPGDDRLLIAGDGSRQILDWRRSVVLSTAPDGKGPLSLTRDGRRVAYAREVIFDERRLGWMVDDVAAGKPVLAVAAGKHDSPQVAAISGDGRTLVALDSVGITIWTTYPTSQELIDAAKQIVTRCLTPQQREAAFLSPDPPRWCITGAGREAEKDPVKWDGKWPYRSEAWKQWLVARDKGESPEMPPDTH